jgi:hypothetical protein
VGSSSAEPSHRRGHGLQPRRPLPSPQRPTAGDPQNPEHARGRRSRDRRRQPAHYRRLGIAQGGSTAFLTQLAQPKKLVALEKDSTPVAALEHYIASHALQDAVKVHYSVDQADRAALDDIVDSEFGTEPLDLVIDNASHLLHETRVSFNALFPRLRPGGVYMIEDWYWAHDTKKMDDPVSVDLRELFAAVPLGVPLTVLVFELVMICASDSTIVAELVVDRSFVRVRRGRAELNPSTFDISQSYAEGPIKLLAPGVEGQRSSER